MDAKTAGLHVGVEGEDVAAEAGIVEPEDDGVAVSLIEGDAFRILAGSLLGKAVDDRDDGGVGDGEDGFAEDGVALELFAWAGIDAVVAIELLPVDGIALGKPDVIVDAEGGAHVAGGIAAGVGRDIVVAGEGRMRTAMV